MNKPRAVALLSGGLDSTVLTYYLRRRGYDVRALSVFYGQRHSKELSAAIAIAASGEPPIDHRVVNLADLRQLMQGSSQTDDHFAVPDGHYADASMKITVVPNRNMILLSCAIAYAISVKAEVVAYAAHAGDHAIYPDCRPEFVKALMPAVALCDYNPPNLIAPFVQMSKEDLVVLGDEIKAPLHLTWSCYKGADLHCGTCGTCVERKEAFQRAHVADPTTYLAGDGTYAPQISQPRA